MLIRDGERYVNMVLNVHSFCFIRLIRDGENGEKGVWRWGKR